MEPTIAAALGSAVSRRVVEYLAKHGRARYRELAQHLDSNELADALEKLKGAKLVAEKGAPVQDFKLFFLTAKGLTAERQM